MSSYRFLLYPYKKIPKCCVTAQSVKKCEPAMNMYLGKKSKMSELQKEALKNKYGGLPSAPRRPGKTHG